MPARAAVAALLVGTFLAAWVWLDRKSPGKYDTFFEFAPYTTTTFDEFQAVRWQADPASRGSVKKDAQGKPIEKTSTFKKTVGAKGTFVEEGTNKHFALISSKLSKSCEPNRRNGGS